MAQEFETLMKEGNLAGAFKSEYNYITKATKSTPDWDRLSKATKNVMSVFPDIAAMPKYATSIKKVGTRLQCDLWTLFNNTSHETLTEDLMDDLWIDGRRAWLLLDEYTITQRFVRAFFHTLEMATAKQTRALYDEFRENLIASSGVPGLALRLANELISFQDSRFKEPAMDKKLLAKTSSRSPATRETFKEIKAFVQTLKLNIFNTQKWRRHNLEAMGRIAQTLMDLITSETITDKIEREDVQEVIYGYAQITHNLCTHLVDKKIEDADVLFAFRGVLLPINESIGKMAAALAETFPSRSGDHKYVCFSVYSFLRVIQTIDKLDLDKTKTCSFVETALTNVVGGFKYLSTAARNTDDFATLKHWGLVELTINELSRICETYGLVSYEKTNVMTIYRALEIKITPECTKMETLLIRMFLNQLLLENYKRSSSEASLFSLFGARDKEAKAVLLSLLLKVLSENGVPQNSESVVIIVDTLLEFGNIENLPESDQELLKLALFQLREFFPKETKKLAHLVTENEDEQDELTTVWKILSSWQKELQLAWSAQRAKIKSPAPSLDVKKLCSIKVRDSFRKSSTATQVCNYANTFYIAAQLLLIVGKREAGNKLIKDLLKLLIDWYSPDKSGKIDCVCELIADLSYDLGILMWVSYKHSHFSSQPDFDVESQELMKKASSFKLSKVEATRLAFGNMMNEAILSQENKTMLVNKSDESVNQTLLDTIISNTSSFADYQDKAMGHVGSIVTENDNCGLRYSIQLLVTVLSLTCDRTFYSTLFASKASKEGAIKVPKIGKEILSTLRVLEKITWITVEIAESMITQGMSIEARQFSNELLCLSEIWGLQTPFIIAKTLQIRALELEGQTRKWREEIPALLDVFDLNEDNQLMRQIDPQAKAAALSLDPPRRNSSQVVQTDSHLPTAKIKEEYLGDVPASPMTKKIRKQTEKSAPYSFDLPELPKMSAMDLEVARNYIIALTTMFRVHPDPIRAVHAGHFLFKEVVLAGHKLSQCLLELAHVLVLRAIELDRQSPAVANIQTVFKNLRNSTTLDPKKSRRFARLQVAFVVYERTFESTKENFELEAPFQKMTVKCDMKTPVRRRMKDPKIAATPNITPMKPVNVKLKGLKKEKLQVFNDKDRAKSIALGTPRSSRPKIDSFDDDSYQPSTPVAPSIKSARVTRAAARRAVKMEVVEEDRAGEIEELETPDESVFVVEEPRAGAFGDGLDLSPIKIEKNEAECFRLQGGSSRPVSPIEAEVNTIFSVDAMPAPSTVFSSEKAILDEALATAKSCKDMETMRAIYNLRIGSIIREQQETQGSTMILSNSENLAGLHIEAVGVGALIDTQYGCQVRLANNMPAVTEENKAATEKMLDSLNTNDVFLRKELNDAVVIVSLIPHVSKTFSCTYEKCLALVTRLAPNGKNISVGFDGTAFAKESGRMRDTADKISDELSKEVTDSSTWWERRNFREKYCSGLSRSVLPDILGPALPLFTFPKSITWSSAVPKPKNSLHAEYLGYAIRAWSHLNTLGKTNVAGLVGVRKVELDRLAKSHSCVEMEYQRTTATYLVLGRLVQSIAFERMPICQGIRMSRMPSVRHAEFLLRSPLSSRSADISELLYVVDSLVNLAQSAKTVGTFFNRVSTWDGYTSVAPPSSELINKLNAKSIYIFAGHGSGSDCVGGWGRVLRKGVTSKMHLIGCASGRLRDHGRTEPRGAINKIMDSGSKSVMGMLWSITDRDIDRFTLRLYCDWFCAKSNSSKESGPCLSRFINESARACKLPAINGGACVNYGLIPTCHNVPAGYEEGLPKIINYQKG